MQCGSSNTAVHSVNLWTEASCLNVVSDASGTYFFILTSFSKTYTSKNEVSADLQVAKCFGNGFMQVRTVVSVLNFLSYWSLWPFYQFFTTMCDISDRGCGILV